LIPEYQGNLTKLIGKSPLSNKYFSILAPLKTAHK